jgi:UPF0755 protein
VVAAVLAAAGSGERLGADRPKAFVRLGDRPLLAESLERLEASASVESIVIAAPPGWEEPSILLAEELGCGKVSACVTGGATRGESVRLALAEVPEDAAVVVVHDAARPLLPDEVLGKLARGEVKLYRFTVPEGLRIDEIAPIVGATTICSAADFLKLARDPAVAKKAGVPGQSLEGFLFPDTYSVTRNAGCPGIVQLMVNRFREEWHKAQAQRAEDVTLNELQAVTLASIVEKETGQPAERPRIACVFHNRLRRGMKLQTDPTVIYALLLENGFNWDGNLRKSDLSRAHPYNTYYVKGLPPGPICNPGAASLQAAINPAQCNDLFFVSRNDHTHVFCPDFACHERNVRKFQIEYFRHKRG